MENDAHRITISDLQKIEAQWVHEETQDFVRLIQRYRSIYITAVFLSVGWVLGQIVGALSIHNTQAVPPLSSTPQSILDELRHRSDVALVLCVIPLLNVLFAMLMLEAYAQIQSLARYRFILGVELGDGEPGWRWELWRNTPEGSIRSWTNPTNVFFGLVVIGLTVASLWFGAPAAWDNTTIWWVWMISLGFFLALIVVVITAGLSRIRVNRVADEPTTRWPDLTIHERPVNWIGRIIKRLRRRRTPRKRRRDE